MLVSVYYLQHDRLKPGFNKILILLERFFIRQLFFIRKSNLIFADYHFNHISN
jgi:hypothetical protein